VTLDRKSAARTLRRIAALLELNGENPHRVRAFAGAARTVERVEGDLVDAIRSGAILKLRGIGRGVAAVLGELAEGRTPAVLAELERRTPPGLLELFEIPGLGPRRIRTLWTELGIASLGELEYACHENRLVDLPGFGDRTQAAILERIRDLRRYRARRLLPDAWAEAEAALALVGTALGAPAEAAGELRRGGETVAEIVLVAALEPAAAAAPLEALGFGPVGPGRWRRTAEGALPVTVAVAPADRFGAVLLHETGSEGHLERLAHRAAAGGLRLERDGLYTGGERIPAPDEAAVYARLGLPWIPPELREDLGELELAASGALPELVRLEDLRGALHNHTTASDGLATEEEMARAAVGRGLAFLGIADHSPAAHYAGGLDVERLREQWGRIDAWNAAHPELRLIKGLEADILPDGSLDLPEGAQEGLEYVVASVHSAFRLGEEKQTRRIVAAVRHPACRILGHPTGRLLLARPGYAVDLEEVLQACAETGVAVEINANPHRLDLDWRWARRALDLGAVLAIDPDAHATDGLDDLRWGVTVARKAGAPAGRVLGAGLDLEGWLAARRGVG